MSQCDPEKFVSTGEGGTVLRVICAVLVTSVNSKTMKHKKIIGIPSGWLPVKTDLPVNGFPRVAVVISTPGLESRNNGATARIRAEVARIMAKVASIRAEVARIKVKVARIRAEVARVRAKVGARNIGQARSPTAGRIVQHVNLTVDATGFRTAPICTTKRIFHHSRGDGIQ